MSRFTNTMYANARWSLNGMVTGEPHHPVRHTWREVHERARQVAGGPVMSPHFDHRRRLSLRLRAERRMILRFGVAVAPAGQRNQH